MTKYINIHAKTVPNPLAMTFVIENQLLTEGAYMFESKAAALSQSPLAAKLFELDFVTQVFISQDFITVSKTETEEDWVELMPPLRVLIKRTLESGTPLLNLEDIPAPAKEPEDTFEKQLKALIDQKIRPATRMDGGDITFASYADGVVKVNLAGSCVGCPFAPRTIKSGVEKLLKGAFPELKEVTSDQVDWNAK